MMFDVRYSGRSRNCTTSLYRNSISDAGERGAFILSYTSRKFLKKADKILARRLVEKIEKLREDPIIHDTKRVGSSKGLFRIRVSDWRILYEVDYRNNLIGVVKIDKRRTVYD